MNNKNIKGIPFHSTYDVLDSTKAQTYMSCPRLFFFQYILGFRPDRPIHALEFGKAWHLAKEVLFDEGYSEASVKKGMELFMGSYRQNFGEDTDMDFHPKSPGNAELALHNYIIDFKDDEFEVLATEIGCTFLLNKGRVMHGKMDSIVRDPLRGILSIDSKSAGAHWGYLEDSFQQKFQMLAYTYFLHSYYEERIGGVMIDACIFKKSGNEQFRIPIEATLNHIEDWVFQADLLFDALEEDWNRLSKVKESDTIMKAFPKCTESCVKYNRICPMFEICNSWHNPLQKLDRIPSGMKVEFWDPRKEDVKTTMEIKL